MLVIGLEHEGGWVGSQLHWPLVLLATGKFGVAFCGCKEKFEKDNSKNEKLKLLRDSLIISLTFRSSMSHHRWMRRPPEWSCSSWTPASSCGLGRGGGVVLETGEPRRGRLIERSQ